MMTQIWQNRNERRFKLYRELSQKEMEQRKNLHHQAQLNQISESKYYQRNGMKKRSQR